MLFSRPALVTLLLFSAAPLSAGEKVVAVLSKASGAYMEAFSAFREEYGKDIPYIDISKTRPLIPPGTGAVVAFGTKAASYKYPPGVKLVYTLAPGFRNYRKGSVKISMLPPPDLLLKKIKLLHPALKRLRVFWRSPWYSGMGEQYEKAGKSAGVEIRSIKVSREANLPGMLRSSLGSTDAIWLPPDPLLISRMTLKLFSGFARANSIPIFASTTGLAKKGACAAIGPSFSQLGGEAAAAAKALGKGKSLPPVIHARNLRLTLNLSEARNCGLIFSTEAAESADKYYP